MSSAATQITHFPNAYATDDSNGAFWLTNSPEGFKCVRPSANPVDAKGHEAIFASSDVVATRCSLKKMHKLDVYGDVAFCAYTQSASFT